MQIRPEQPGDFPAIDALVAAAFGQRAEAVLVERLRADPDAYRPELTLVAVDDGGEVVGHVMVSMATLDDGTTTRPVASLAPLAVRPDVQTTGIGKALLAAVRDATDAAGEPVIVLQGSPTYYAKSGYEPAAAHGITMDLPEWAPQEAAQVLRLAGYDPAWRGLVVYPSAFDGLD
jgi:putative acetyltransferase